MSWLSAKVRLFRGLQQCVCLGVCNSGSIYGSAKVRLFRGLQQWVCLGVYISWLFACHEGWGVPEKRTVAA